MQAEGSPDPWLWIPFLRIQAQGVHCWYHSCFTNICSQYCRFLKFQHRGGRDCSVHHSPSSSHPPRFWRVSSETTFLIRMTLDNELWFDLSIEVSAWSYKDSMRNTFFLGDPSRRSPWSGPFWRIPPWSGLPTTPGLWEDCSKCQGLEWDGRHLMETHRKKQRLSFRFLVFPWGFCNIITWKVFVFRTVAAPKISRKGTEFKSKTTEGFCFATNHYLIFS